MTVTFISNSKKAPQVISEVELSVCPRENEYYNIYGNEFIVKEVRHSAIIQKSENGKNTVQEKILCVLQRVFHDGKVMTELMNLIKKCQDDKKDIKLNYSEMS